MVWLLERHANWNDMSPTVSPYERMRCAAERTCRWLTAQSWPDESVTIPLPIRASVFAILTESMVDVQVDRQTLS